MTGASTTRDQEQVVRGSAGEVFAAFLKLGLTSFGGPIAHLGYFRDELVLRRKWIGEQGYADLVALCQFLPGPASSQVGFALGPFRGGPLGAAAAWAAFTLPSAILLVLFVFGAAALGGPIGSGIIHGPKVIAVKVNPLAADLDVSFVDMPSTGYVPLPSVEALQQFRCISDGPTVKSWNDPRARPARPSSVQDRGN